MEHNRREYDLVIFGVTGFTGRLVAEYISHKYGSGNSLKWAIAGRNSEELSKICKDHSLKSLGQAVSIITADSLDKVSLSRMVKKTKVICSTVGPYAKYGTKLVVSCIENKTDYCDISGEVQWIRKLIHSYNEKAINNKVRIVNSCGFDSIPSDFGVWYVQRNMMQRYGVSANYVRCRIKKLRGSASGGTIASMLNIIDDLKKDRKLLMEVADPYSLNPVGLAQGLDKWDQRGAIFDRDFECWTIPFIMAGINTRIVRRSNALLDFQYGRDFRYDEAVMLSKKISSTSAKIRGSLMGLLQPMLSVGLVRALVKPFLPSPGEGPNSKERKNGFYDMRFLAQHPSDKEKNILAKVYGDMDPGYGSTSKMLAESALCLVNDKLEKGGGIWTPSSLMGKQLFERLESNAGLSFSIVDQN